VSARSILGRFHGVGGPSVAVLAEDVDELGAKAVEEALLLPELAETDEALGFWNGAQFHAQRLRARVHVVGHRVEEGVRNYGLVLTLLTRARFEKGWVPVLR